MHSNAFLKILYAVNSKHFQCVLYIFFLIFASSVIGWLFDWDFKECCSYGCLHRSSLPCIGNFRTLSKVVVPNFNYGVTFVFNIGCNFRAVDSSIKTNMPLPVFWLGASCKSLTCECCTIWEEGKWIWLTQRFLMQQQMSELVLLKVTVTRNACLGTNTL